MKYKLISIDLAKNVFQIALLDQQNTLVSNKKVPRNKLLHTLRQFSPTLVVMEACYSSNHWGRAISKLGHTVKLIPARLVKAFLIGNKNDANDALAIAEASQRPKIHFVAVKTIEQQDIQSLQRIREQLIKQSTANVNQLRGLLAEYGVITGKTKANLMAAIPCCLEEPDNELSSVARSFIHRLYERQKQLTEEVKAVTEQMVSCASQHSDYQLLSGIPGVGPIIASNILGSINSINEFKNGRQLSAWLGLTPSQYSSGEHNRLGKITKRGNATLRKLLIQGARAVINWCDRKNDPLSKWLQQLRKRTHDCKLTVALANKLARIIWAVLSKQTPYDGKLACAN
ncbi:MAG: IS110 family transposase [Aliivibrio sp.]|uniref:IS110 family transposase n=1 Tax=Aliivibrio sp. TaxID=1872443 RepID=UPI001A52FF36|nr:IS110 family transposase [Aliivibrio sp.]